MFYLKQPLAVLLLASVFASQLFLPLRADAIEIQSSHNVARGMKIAAAKAYLTAAIAEQVSADADVVAATANAVLVGKILFAARLPFIPGTPGFIIEGTGSLNVADVSAAERAFLESKLEVKRQETRAAEAAKHVTEATKALADAEAEMIEGILEILERVLLNELKKKILDMMVDQIVQYIQGGGEPRFVTDWQGFFGDVAQGAAGDFAKELGLGFLCSPFSLQVRLSLLPSRRFGARFDCTLDKIVGNIQNFYDDFRNGGWVAFDSALQMNNNYYGSLLLAWDERANTIARALYSAEHESATGFLPAKTCFNERGAKIPDKDRAAYEDAVRKDKTRTKSITCQIITPGDTVGAAAKEAIGADIKWLVNADDLAAYIAAITDALIGRVFKEGVGLLGAATQSAPQRRQGSSGDELVLPPGVAAANARFNTSRADQLNASALNTNNNPPPFTELDARTSIKFILSDYITIQGLLIAALAELKDCQIQRTSAVASPLPASTHDLNFWNQSLQATNGLLAAAQSKLVQLQQIRDANTAAFSALSNAGQNEPPASLLILLDTTAQQLDIAKSTIGPSLIDANARLQVCLTGKP